MPAFSRIHRVRLAALSIALTAAGSFGISVSAAGATQRLDLHDYVHGRIILQMQEHNEAWYVYPGDDRRYSLGNPSEASQIMRTFGLGVRHQLIANTTDYPTALAGQILLDVDDRGKAYYVNPVDLHAYYLGSAAQAFNVLRQSGVGVTDADLYLIPIGDPLQVSGCAYHRPDCPAIYACVNNYCQLKTGCAYNNPSCGGSQECVDNQCVAKKIVVKKVVANNAVPSRKAAVANSSSGSSPRVGGGSAPAGCAYGTLSCGPSYACVNNVCRQKPGEWCLHPDHSVCIAPGLRTNLWQCDDDYFEFNGQCYPKAKPAVPRALDGRGGDGAYGTCELNHGVGAAWDVSKNRCVCKDGFSVAADGSSCRPADLWCASQTGANSYYNFIVDSCVCRNGYAFVGSSCQ